MKYRVASLAVAATLMAAQSAAAAGLPQIRTSERNAVPECVTPGRLTAYLRDRNAGLDSRFSKIAVEYMRHGEDLNLRWDYAFFQMLIETGYLTFMRDGHRPGLVKPSQNNFAGLGAVGKGQPGEAFDDVSTGVRAHLEHVLMYTGNPVENPVAERTRKIMEWGVLTSWQKTIKGPMTYAHLAQQWAKNRGYAEMIATVGERFFEQFCNKPDPHPDFVREARAGRGVKSKAPVETAVLEEKPQSVSGIELARQAIEDGKAEGNDKRSGLGASSLVRVIGDLTKTDGDTMPETKPGKDIAASPQHQARHRHQVRAIACVGRRRAGKACRSRTQVSRLDGELRRRESHHHQGAERHRHQLYRARRQRRRRETRGRRLHRGLCQGRNGQPASLPPRRTPSTRRSSSAPKADAARMMLMGGDLHG